MNVIWIVSDTVRRDAIGAYGLRKMHTPAIDSLAAKGTLFDRHYIAAFPTMPARADFMTGRWTMSFMGWEPLPKGEGKSRNKGPWRVPSDRGSPFRGLSETGGLAPALFLCSG